MFRQQDERSGCSSAEPYPLACQHRLSAGDPDVRSGCLLQQVVDGEVLLDQRQAARQGMSGLLGREPFQTAMADAVVLAEVTVNRLEAVVGLASDDVRLLAFGVSLPANNPLMSESCSDIVERGASRDDGVGVALMLGQHVRDPTVAGVEQLGEVAVGEQSTLLVGLLAEAEGSCATIVGEREDDRCAACTSSAVERSRRTGTSSVSAMRWRRPGGSLTLTAIQSTCRV